MPHFGRRREIERLREIDAALASKEGMHLPTIAARQGVHEKTIRRDIDLLEEFVGPTIYQRVPERPNETRHWYVCRGRLFAPER